MSKIARFVVWICSKFTRVEIEQIINGLLDVLNNRNTEVKPKDDFKEKHPNYRNFFVDPLPPPESSDRGFPLPNSLKTTNSSSLNIKLPTANPLRLFNTALILSKFQN
jgi:hypothetical protein